jgi:hypothetical protein
MGLVAMSEQDLRRIEVMSEVLGGRRTIASAAATLTISVRQVHRLLCAYRSDGAGAIAHKARGRPSNNRIQDGIREYALELVRIHYRDFGPTLAAEMLADKHSLAVSRETLRKWMASAGLWLSRRQRRTFHQLRLRREAYGELVQIDGSDHRWFEDRAEPCTLLVFIDDATGKLMQLLFVVSESTFSYFDALRLYLNAHGSPVAFYSDKHTVFRVARTEAQGGQGMTQFGRALAELHIEILCANSSQAKGRVERVNRTLQDRLVKELRLAGVSSIKAGNAFLPDFTERFNARFSITPARPNDLHRSITVSAEHLDSILCHREQRYVGRQLTLSYGRKRIMLQPGEQTSDLGGRYVDIFAFADDRMDIRSNGIPLSYTMFDKDQRVSHTAIVENKRLGEALSFVKARQDLLPPHPKTNSEKMGYRKTGTKTPGRKRPIERAPITAPLAPQNLQGARYEPAAE